jgi:hypothetical protein
MKEWHCPEDIDQIATSIVRKQYGPDDDSEWETYKAIAEALITERKNFAELLMQMSRAMEDATK